MSGAILAPPAASNASPLATPAVTVSFIDSNDIANYDFQLPAEQESLEALLHIDLTEDAAQEIWDRFRARDPDSPYGLLDFVKRHVETCDIEGLSDEEALTKMGLNADLQDRLLDPEFSDLLYTEELKYWVVDTLEVNYLTIGDLLERERNRAERALRAQSN